MLFPGYLHVLVMWLLCNITINTMNLMNDNKLDNLQKTSLKLTLHLAMIFE